MPNSGSKGLYHLTQGDKDIFDRARRENNPNVITNYYLRSENSGTWWRHVPDNFVTRLVVPESQAATIKWQQGYNDLFAVWKYYGEPEFFGPRADGVEEWSALTREAYAERRENVDRVYKTVWEDGPYPVFHHSHGPMFLPWQLAVHRDNSPIQVIPGGMGSGKTLSKMFSMLCRAILLPGYRALALAPLSKQAEEVHTLAVQYLLGTEYEARFLIGTPLKPYPKLVIGHEEVGRNTIECFPVLDGASGLLTLTCDEALVDQAEQILDLTSLLRQVSTRFRGVIRGRPRRGQISLCANSDDNPELWDKFDEGNEEGNETIFSYAPATTENEYLTPADLFRFESTVGDTDEDKQMYMFGARPVGAGEHFPAASLKLCRSKSLDTMMAENLEKKTPGWVRVEEKKVHVRRWERPYEAGRRYLVAADPGWDNPPNRNSPAIMVWDFTDFPAQPATLAAFAWVSGNHSPNPWLQQYFDYVAQYKAVGFNGYDSTGVQSGYERLTDMQSLLFTPVPLNGNKKYVYLTLLKKLMADGKFAMPHITHIFSQLAKYKLPDDGLRQDLVSALLVSAALLEPFWYEPVLNQPQPEQDYDPDDRHYRPYDREATALHHER